MVKRMVPADSEYSKGATIPFHGVFDSSGDVWTAGEEARWNSENREIGDVFACGATTRALRVRRRPRPDSTHEKGLKTSFHRVLTLDVMCEQVVKKELRNLERFCL